MATTEPKTEKVRKTRKSRTEGTEAFYVRIPADTVAALNAEAERRMVAPGLIVNRAVLEWLAINTSANSSAAV